MTGPVRVAICEDSRTYAHRLRRFLEADGRLEVVLVAASAEQLLDELARADADLVTMDLELPGIDGVQAIERIMAMRPMPIVVVSGHLGPSPSITLRAIAAGALLSVGKDDLRLDLRDGPVAEALRSRLIGLARKPDRITAPRTPARTPPVVSADDGKLPRAGHVTAVGIGASAGGPAALSTALGLLPATFPLPVLVVQHMSEGFIPEFASWLDDLVAPAVRVARDGEPAGPGVALAPDGAHLRLGRDGRLHLDTRPDADPHRPSADALLSSLADTAGRGALAVILTGMGRDGAAGVAAVRAAGGAALAQSADQAMLSGMPTAAAEAGAAAAPLSEIARTLASIAPRVPA
jgi:two-component system, chemotaxis family, protein-glutamate methylesterase/glutaminase